MMQSVIRSLLFCFVLSGMMSASSQQKQPKSCWDIADTQAEMNDCAYKQSADAERELNRVYKAVLKKYADDVVVIKKLKVAQRAWLTFRDAEIEAQYPELNAYGSAQPMCEAMIKNQLTQQRIKQLRVWLEGIEEGDVCSGAIKIRAAKARNGRKPQ